MTLRPPVFETGASANSATQASGISIALNDLRVHASMPARANTLEYWVEY